MSGCVADTGHKKRDDVCKRVAEETDQKSANGSRESCRDAKAADEENTLRKAAWCLYASEAGGQRTITATR